MGTITTLSTTNTWLCQLRIWNDAKKQYVNTGTKLYVDSFTRPDPRVLFAMQNPKPETNPMNSSWDMDLI